MTKFTADAAWMMTRMVLRMVETLGRQPGAISEDQRAVGRLQGSRNSSANGVGAVVGCAGSIPASTDQAGLEPAICHQLFGIVQR